MGLRYKTVKEECQQLERHVNLFFMSILWLCTERSEIQESGPDDVIRVTELVTRIDFGVETVQIELYL